MKKIINITLCGLSLEVIEYFLLLSAIQIENILKYNIPILRFSGSLRDANEISFTRFVFYFLFWVIAIYLLYDKINIKQPILKLGVANCSLYILLSLGMTLFFPFAIEFFSRSFFYFLIISTFLSPFILNILPFFKRIIATI